MIAATKLYKRSLRWQDVTPITLHRYRTMIGSQRAVLKRFGKPITDLSDEELAKYIILRLQETKKEAKKEGLKEAAASIKRHRTIKERIEAYKKQYSIETETDEAALRNLCQIEMMLENLEDAEEEVVKKLKDNTATSDMINSIVNAKVRYSTEYRQSLASLNLDRASRDKNEKGGTDYIRDVIVQSQALLASKTVKIQCEHCASTGTLLAQGFVLCHFIGWRFSVDCPKCGRPITLKG